MKIFSFLLVATIHCASVLQFGPEREDMVTIKCHDSLTIQYTPLSYSEFVDYVHVLPDHAWNYVEYFSNFYETIRPTIFKRFIDVLAIEKYDERMLAAMKFDHDIIGMMAPFKKEIQERLERGGTNGGLKVSHFLAMSALMIFTPRFKSENNGTSDLWKKCNHNDYFSVRLFMSLHTDIFQYKRVEPSSPSEICTHFSAFDLLGNDLTKLILFGTEDYLHWARMTCKMWQALTNLSNRIRFVDPDQIANRYFEFYHFFDGPKNGKLSSFVKELVHKQKKPELAAKLLAKGIAFDFTLHEQILSILIKEECIHKYLVKEYRKSILFERQLYTVKKAFPKIALLLSMIRNERSTKKY